MNGYEHQEIEELKQEIRELRELLWAHHYDHYQFLYGDDGQMQCAKCMVDFITDPVERIRKGMAQGGR